MAYRYGWKVFHMPATTLRGSQGRGYHDLTLARNRFAMWLELKQENGDVRPEQLEWIGALPTGLALVIRPSDLGWLEDWLR